MPLPELLAALERDLATELAQRDADTARAVADVHAAASAEAAQLTSALVTAAGADAAAQAHRLLAAARADARTQRRQAEARAWEDLHEQVRRRLAAARTDPVYHDTVLPALLDEALAVLAPAVVRVDPGDTATVTGLLGERGVSADVDPVLACWGGLELDDGAGRTVVNTLERRFEAALADLRRLLATAAAAT